MVTPAWLTAVLQNGRVVESAQVEPLPNSGKTGAILLRAELVYSAAGAGKEGGGGGGGDGDDDDLGMPASVVIKLAERNQQVSPWVSRFG